MHFFEYLAFKQFDTRSLHFLKRQIAKDPFQRKLMDPNRPEKFERPIFPLSIPRQGGGQVCFWTPPPTLTKDFRKIYRGFFKAHRRRKCFGIPFLKSVFRKISKI